MPKLTVRGATGPAIVYRFDDAVVTIGRSEGNDLVIGDAELSRVHAELRREADGWAVADRCSMNGTSLNGRLLSVPEVLVPGDEIRVGETVIVFEAEVGDAISEEKASATLPTPRLTHRGGRLGLPDVRLVGCSPGIRSVTRLIERFAPSSSTLLVTGENGTGKELVARLVHARSPRASGPFVIVNCPALPSTLVEAELFGVERGVATGVEQRMGRLEAAAGGTVFLDEIGDLDIAAQAKLLRFLQDRVVERVGGRGGREVDVRVVAATNHDLAADIARGTFRRDLYHRLDVTSIELPPLRTRREDIPPLCEHFLGRGGPTLSPDALEALSAYEFPGNVRELRHALERAVLLRDGGVLRREDLPRRIVEPGAPSVDASALAEAERLCVLLRERKGNFWDLVRTPFLQRRLSREVVNEVVKRLHDESGASYRRMASTLGLATDYRKFIDFLRHNALRPED